MANKKKPPGVMFYFDEMRNLDKLSDAERGQMLTCILAYAADGIIPVFDDVKMAIIWAFIQARIDADAQHYNDKILHNKYASFCAKLDRQGCDRIAFDEWLALTDPERAQLVSLGIKRNPITMTTSTTNVTTTPPTESASPTNTWPTMCQAAFAELVTMYPAHRRGNIYDTYEIYRRHITSAEVHKTAMDNLAAWIHNTHWTKEDGRFVPSLGHWIENGSWRLPPQSIKQPNQWTHDPDQNDAIINLLNGDIDKIIG